MKYDFSKIDFAKDFKCLGLVCSLSLVCDADKFHKNDVRCDLTVGHMEGYYAELLEMGSDY